MKISFLLAGVAAAFFLSVPALAQTPVHALAMHGDPKYPAGFSHFEYVNPQAPKGGSVKLAVAGTFDSLNPFILKGVAAPGLGLVYQTLLESSLDEAFTEYGQIAESIEMPEDRSWVAFNLRAEAKWHDGKPLTSDDVVWTFNTLMEKGAPFYRAYYANVKQAQAEGPHRVKFVFDMAGNRELPLIMGQLPVLPRHFWEGRDFGSSLDAYPVGSGPYKIKSVSPGQSIVYERVKDWWGENLPTEKGRHNFDTIAYELYRDENVLIKALLAGSYDFRLENIAKAWATEYKHPNVDKGLIKKVEIKNEVPTGMQGFAYNTRRAMFADAKTRQALAHAFDFEWSNRQFAFGAYKRTESYFSNSELASSGLPQGRELEILQAYRGKIPDEVFTQEYRAPKTDGSGRGIRANLSTAAALLKEAGWEMKDGLLHRDGRPFRFEILLNSPAFERWVLPFIANLKKIGVEASVRTVDTAQYQARVDAFDFDMIVQSFGQSLSPGNEQRDFWGSDKADVRGSRNVIGVRDPVVDDLIGKIVAAADRDELIAFTRALDRVLLWNHYVIPHWHINVWRVAYWDKFGRPDIAPKYGLGFPDTWWAKGN